MNQDYLSADELQRRMEGISINYHLVDVRRDKRSFYALEDEIKKIISEYDGKVVPKNWLCISGLVLNLIMDGDLKQANEIINLIPDNGYMGFLKFGLLLVNPTITFKEFFHIINYLKKIKKTLGFFILTAGRPSILNGYNDFTRIGPFLEKKRDLFIEDLSMMYEKSYCPAIYNLCLAEYYYYQDKLFDAGVLVSRTIKSFDREKETRLLFAALYLQSKILLASGRIVKTDSYISNIRQLVKKTGTAEFSYNIDATEVMAAFYEGNSVLITNWYKNHAPDEFADFNMLDLYQYMVKMRCYIIDKKYTAVVALAEKLRPLLKMGKRHMDLCELDLLLAISFYRSSEKELAFETFERVLKTVRHRKYYRLIADEGEAVLHLLIEYMAIKGKSDFLLQLLESTRRMAINHPLYLNPVFKNETFSQMETDILKLLEQGKSKEKIAEYFFISVNTVKYHIKSIYTKLQVSNAIQAVWQARVMGII